jgi:hypothetical protein
MKYLKRFNENYRVLTDDEIQSEIDRVDEIKDHILDIFQPLKYKSSGSVVSVKSGFSGQFSIKSPSITCDSSLNLGGPVGGSGHALSVHETISGTVLINSNLSNISVYSGGNNSAAKIGSGYITINGNLNGNNEIGLYLTNGDDGNVTINEDILSLLPSAVTKNDAGILSLSYREVHTAKIARLEKEVEILKARLNES